MHYPYQDWSDKSLDHSIKHVKDNTPNFYEHNNNASLLCNMHALSSRTSLIGLRYHNVFANVNHFNTLQQKQLSHSHSLGYTLRSVVFVIQLAIITSVRPLSVLEE